MSDELRQAANKKRRDVAESIARHLQRCAYSNPSIAVEDVANEVYDGLDPLCEPEDSFEPVTEDWLRSVGFETLCNGTRANITWPQTGVPIGLWKVSDKEWSVTHRLSEFRRISTRGEVRRLCAALGVELRETEHG